MPIPKPQKNENETDFISRCMRNNTMIKDYKDQNQRVGVCFDSWKNNKGEKMDSDKLIEEDIKEVKRDSKGRLIIAENINIVFNGEIIQD